MKLILVISLLWVLNAVAQEQPHRHSIWYNPHSGIAGGVFLKLVSEVHGKGPGPSYVPIEATVAIYSPSGRFITQVTSDAGGRFQVGLRSGTYVVVPLVPAAAGTADPPPPWYALGGPQTVAVGFKQYTTITVLYGRSH